MKIVRQKLGWLAAALMAMACLVSASGTGTVALTTGTSAISTSSATPVVLSWNGAQTIAGSFKLLTVVNTGGVTGLLSIDGGNNWMVLPASSSRSIQGPTFYGATIEIENTPGGSNLSGIYGDAE